MTHEEIIKVLKACGTSDAADAMLILGIEGGLMPNLRAVQPMAKFAGRAFTSKFEYIEEGDKSKWFYEDVMDPNSPYLSGYDTIDACPPGDVLISGGADDKGIGGLLAYRAALNKGVEAYVFDGRTRDYDEISRYSLPQFCTGRALIMGPDNLKEVEVNVPIVCDGVPVRPGDYLIGDGDGVVCIQQERIEEVTDMIRKILQVEKAAMEALDKKLPPLEIEKISASRARLMKKNG